MPPKQEVKPTPSDDTDKYGKLKDDLVKDILKKQELEKKLQELEDSIYEKENDYFNESVYGNIIKGFENFSKASGSTNKKRLQYTDYDHIFSMSSTNYIKQLMKKQGVVNGSADFEDYEDVVKPKEATEEETTAATPGRKRKLRVSED